MQSYLVLLRTEIDNPELLQVSDFLPTLPKYEQMLIGEHFAYMEKLERENLIQFGGPSSNFNHLLFVIKATSHDEARQIAESDPLVKAGICKIELFTEFIPFIAHQVPTS